MGSVSASYDNAAWDFTADFTSVESPMGRLEVQKQPDDLVNVCSDFNCFTGMAVAIPLSLLAWAGIIAFFYLLIRHFQ